MKSSAVGRSEYITVAPSTTTRDTSLRRVALTKSENEARTTTVSGPPPRALVVPGSGKMRMSKSRATVLSRKRMGLCCFSFWSQAQVGSERRGGPPAGTGGLLLLLVLVVGVLGDGFAAGGGVCWAAGGGALVSAEVFPRDGARGCLLLLRLGCSRAIACTF